MRKLVSGGGQIVSVDQAKTYLKVDVTDDNELIANLIKAAQGWAEKYMRRQLIAATYDLYLDKFEDPIYLYACPASDVVSVKYYDTDGTLQTLSSSYYTVDVISEPGRVALAPDYDWPDIQDRINAVVIRYVSGWADAASVPKAIYSGVLLLIAHLYDNRQAVTKDVYHEMPKGAEYLFDLYKVY